MTNVTYKNIQIYYKGKRTPDSFSNVTLTEHHNDWHKWYRVNPVGRKDTWGLGDYQIDKIEKIEGTLA